MRESTPALWAPPAESGRLTDRVLLSTKIAVPPTRPDVVPRSRLIQKLAAGGQRRLTLIAAPAGFGKTTLLCSWIQQAGLRVAWVTLDNGDEDVYRFWPYVVAALDERTEGWIAGLQLAALSMQGRADVANFIRAFTGSHRYVVDYLMQEVLARQPEHVQSNAPYLASRCGVTSPRFGAGSVRYPTT
jgi:ATP/maltotriose-dependent transcriptional regulator MalT